MGITNCPTHGSRGCYPVSPDLKASPPTADLRPFRKRLTDGDRVLFTVAMSERFANEWGIDRNDAAVLNSHEWFITLHGMCVDCFRTRWLHLWWEAEASVTPGPAGEGQ